MFPLIVRTGQGVIAVVKYIIFQTTETVHLHTDTTVVILVAVPRRFTIRSLSRTDRYSPVVAPAQHLPQSFFARPAELVAPELIDCLLVKRQANGELLWGVIVETEAYSQEEPASAMRSFNLHPCGSPVDIN